MAFDVMQSLFGLTPSAVQQAMRTEEEQRARTQVNLLQGNPFAAGAYAPLQAGERMLSGTRQLAGMADPRMQAAQQLQGIVQSVQQRGVDMATPEGLIELANELNKVPDFAGFAIGMRQQAAKMQTEARKGAIVEGELISRTQKNIALAEKAARDEKKPTEPKKVGVAADDGQIVYLQDGQQFKLGTGGAKIPYYGSIRKETGDITIKGPKETATLVAQGQAATKDIRQNVQKLNRALDLNAQNSPFAGQAFTQEVGAIFGDAQKAAAEINALANTGSLDTRIANRITKFLDGKTTDVTKQDRDAVLKALRNRYEDDYERTLTPFRAAFEDDTQALRIFPKFKDAFSASPGIRKGIPIPAARKAQYPEGSKHQGPKGEKYVVRNGELFTEGE